MMTVTIERVEQTSSFTTDKATQYFMREIEKIAGVLHVRSYNRVSADEQKIIVVVPSLWTSESINVFELEGQTLRKYPDACLTIQLVGLKERNVELTELLSTIPT